MGTLNAIDKALAAACSLRVVRWSILAAAAGLIVGLTWYGIKNKALSLQVSALKGEKAEYAAQLDVQNAAIKKAGDDMAELQKRAQAASRKAADLSKQLQNRQTEINRLELTGDCPDMVQQIVEEVRK